MSCSSKFILVTEKGIFKKDKFDSFISRCTTCLGEFNITNKATALKLLRKASKFAKDVFVNFFLYNYDKNVIKKQRNKLNIHTACI